MITITYGLQKFNSEKVIPEKHFDHSIDLSIKSFYVPKHTQNKQRSNYLPTQCRRALTIKITGQKLNSRIMAPKKGKQ